MTLEKLIKNQLNLRQELKDRILLIISNRCEFGHGRVQRGALHLYVYHQLGFIGHPGNNFAKYLNKILVDLGCRDSYLVGKRCYYGLSFKGEKPENWRNPQASDLPKWINNYQKFDFIKDS